jgi:tetratricopeptide (TPR) repeat protein
MYLGCIARKLAVLLAVFLVALLSAPFAARAACAGPPELTARLKAHPTTENALALGNWFASHQQFDCAAGTLHDALAKDTNSAQLHYFYALALAAGKHIPEAIPELQQSIRLQPDVIPPHLLLASLYARSDQDMEAAQEWQKVLVIDPKNEQALDGLSGELMNHSDFSGTAALLYPAPRTEKLAIRLAQALGLLSYLDQANTVLTEALKENPDSAALARALAVVLVRQRKRDDAVALLQKTVAEHPNDLDATVELYQLLVLTNHFDLARPMTARLMTARPHDRDVLYLTGIMERSAGEYDQAKKHLQESVAIDPDFFNSRYNLGLVEVMLREWEPAKENLEKAIALGTIEPQAHFELAKSLNALGDHDRAQEELKKYQDLKRNEEASVEAAMAAAEADKSLDEGRFSEAIVSYRQAVEAQPDSAYFHYKLSIALHKSGNVDAERKELEEAVRLDPKLPGAQHNLGYLLAHQGDAEGAVVHFRLAVEAAPRWTEAWINLAGELAVSAHYADARKAVAQALELDPHNAQARKLSDMLARDPNAQ